MKTEEEIKNLILQNLSEWSIDLSKYTVLPLEKNDYTGAYTLKIRHTLTGRTLRVPHIFINEQTGDVKWNNIETVEGIGHDV